MSGVQMTNHKRLFANVSKTLKLHHYERFALCGIQYQLYKSAEYLFSYKLYSLASLSILFVYVAAACNGGRVFLFKGRT